MAYQNTNSPYYFGGEDGGEDQQGGIAHGTAPRTAAPPPPPGATIMRSAPQSTDRQELYQGDPTRMRSQRATNIDIESAIAQTVVEYVEESRDFGTSLLRGIRRYVVPFATLMDLSSAVLRFLTLSFLLLLPELYANIFSPAPGAVLWQIAHYTILIISVLGIAVGVPVALFSSVYSLVTLFARRESVYTMTIRRARNERMKYFKMKIRTAWAYIMIAFAAGAFISVPYFTSKDPHFPAGARQIISEISFIIVPLICTIVTMITEREVRMDVVEGGSRMGIGLGMFTAFEAGTRLAGGIGSHQDAAAIRNAMNGDIAGAIAAGVAETPGVTYMTLAEIAEELGRSPAKDDPFRRTLNNIAGAAYRSGQYGIIKHPIKGYMIPQEHFRTLFRKYMLNRPVSATNVTALRVVKQVPHKQDQTGPLVRFLRRLIGTDQPTSAAPNMPQQDTDRTA